MRSTRIKIWMTAVLAAAVVAGGGAAFFLRDARLTSAKHSRHSSDDSAEVTSQPAGRSTIAFPADTDPGDHMPAGMPPAAPGSRLAAHLASLSPEDRTLLENATNPDFWAPLSAEERRLKLKRIAEVFPWPQRGAGAVSPSN